MREKREIRIEVSFRRGWLQPTSSLEGMPQSTKSKANFGP